MNIDDTAFQIFKEKARCASQLLKALAHEERLLILCQLVNGERSVGELLKRSYLSQSAFSQHLAVLRRQNIVKTRKESQVVFYSIADEKAEKILGILHDVYCADIYIKTDNEQKDGDVNNEGVPKHKVQQPPTKTGNIKQ